MADVASVTLLGRMVKDAEVRFASSGTAVVQFGVAVEFTTGRGDDAKKTVSFFDVVSFGKAGEAFAERAKKGTTVAVIGRLQQRTWEQDGAKRSKVEIVAERVFLDDRKNGSTGGGTTGGGSPPSGKSKDESWE